MKANFASNFFAEISRKFLISKSQNKRCEAVVLTEIEKFEIKVPDSCRSLRLPCLIAVPVLVDEIQEWP